MAMCTPVKKKKIRASHAFNGVCRFFLSARTLGLHIKGVEENSRSRRENLFREDECIVQINDTPLQDKTFAE